MLSPPLRRQFLKFCCAELPSPAFEAWVCETPELEDEVGHGTYLDLLSADYLGRDVGGVREVCGRLLDAHHPGTLRIYRVTRLLESMVRDESALMAGFRRLVRLHHDGYEDLVPIEFVGFDSETDSIPSPQSYHLWDPAALAHVLARAAPYLAQIQQAREDLLADLRCRYPDDV
jgi:hypothetical protein